MTQTVTHHLLRAAIVVCVGGLLLASLNFKYIPSTRPYYSVIAERQASEVSVTTTQDSNDTNSRATSK